MTKQKKQVSIADNWIYAVDGGLCAPTKYTPNIDDLSVYQKLDAIAELNNGQHLLDSLSFIAGLMLELDGGLGGTNLTREIKHDRLTILVKFGKRI